MPSSPDPSVLPSSSPPSKIADDDRWPSPDPFLNLLPRPTSALRFLSVKAERLHLRHPSLPPFTSSSTSFRPPPTTSAASGSILAPLPLRLSLPSLPCSLSVLPIRPSFASISTFGFASELHLPAPPPAPPSAPPPDPASALSLNSGSNPTSDSGFASRSRLRLISSIHGLCSIAPPSSATGPPSTPKSWPASPLTCRQAHHPRPFPSAQLCLRRPLPLHPLLYPPPQCHRLPLPMRLSPPPLQKAMVQQQRKRQWRWRKKQRQQ